MSIKKDLRIVRTKKAIKEAFLKLIQEKDFSTITIQNITDEAVINRGTFYLHYLDKYDLLEKVTQEAFDELNEYISPSSYIQNAKINEESLKVVLQHIFESVGNHIEFYRAILGENGIVSIQRQLHGRIKSKFQSEFTMLGNQEHVTCEFLAQFTTSALIGMITWWVESEQRYSTKYMAEQLSLIILNGPFKATGLIE